jgi:hypothetical protein
MVFWHHIMFKMGKMEGLYHAGSRFRFPKICFSTLMHFSFFRRSSGRVGGEPELIGRRLAECSF